MFHASGQIDIMCDELKMISEELPYYGSSGRAIRVLVEKHHKVIAFSENIDKLFSFMTLTQIFMDTTVICALGLFLVTVSISVPNKYTVIDVIIYSTF